MRPCKNCDKDLDIEEILFTQKCPFCYHTIEPISGDFEKW